MGWEPAVSEIIGAVMLIGVIVGGFAIMTAIYVPMAKVDPKPFVKLSMACNQTGFEDLEFPCTRASFNCHPFNYPTCIDDCIWREYGVDRDPDSLDENQRAVINKCLENCMGPPCSDLTSCGNLYICHLGGDALQISDMQVLIDGNPVPGGWEIKNQTGTDTFESATPDTLFVNGNSLRITTGVAGNVDTVTILYTLPTGEITTLAINQFGTDVH